MILIEKTTMIRFDDVAERERINTAFKGRARVQDRKALLAILDAFVAGDLSLCYRLVLSKDRQWLEYVNETIISVIDGVHEQFAKRVKVVEREKKVAAGELDPPPVPVPFGRGLEVIAYPKYAVLAEGKAVVPATVPTIAEIVPMFKDDAKAPQ